MDLLFKSLAKHLEILDYYVDSFLDCNHNVKPLTLGPSPHGLWLNYRHGLGPSRASLEYTLPPSCNTLTRSRPVAVFLKAPPCDELSSKLIIETPTRTEFSSFNLYKLSHFSPFRIIMSLWLTVMIPYCTWMQHSSSSSTPMDIRLYRTSGTYEPPLEHASSYLFL